MFKFKKGQQLLVITPTYTYEAIVDSVDKKDTEYFISILTIHHDIFYMNKYGHIENRHSIAIPKFTIDKGDEVAAIGLFLNDQNSKGTVVSKNDYWNRVSFLHGYEEFSSKTNALFSEKHIQETLADYTEEELANLSEWLVSFIIPINEISLNKTQNKTQKEIKMSTTEKTLTANKDAALSAAKITLGKAAIKAAQKAIKPTVPMMARGYVEHPAAGIIIANAFNFAVQTKFPDNEKACMVANAMMDAAMLLTAEHFDIDGMLEDFMDSVKMPATLKKELKED